MTIMAIATDMMPTTVMVMDMATIMVMDPIIK
jgi:hypothetical protein